MTGMSFGIAPAVRRQRTCLGLERSFSHAGALIIGGLLIKPSATYGRPVSTVLAAHARPPPGKTESNADRQLRAAADELLAAINPNLPANADFTDFAQGETPLNE